MKQSVYTLLATVVLALQLTIADAAPKIRTFMPDSLAQIVASQHGKPFVLLIWSLDCAYCQTSFTTLAQEQRKGLRVITLATDIVENADTTALLSQKLQTFGITSHAWAFGTALPEQLRYAIDPKWHGEVPRSYWFNAHGKSIAHSGVLTPAIVKQLSTSFEESVAHNH